ncbi:MAG: hypothetical protein WBD83_15795, partial [Xanthobacteraceae bacterium]
PMAGGTMGFAEGAAAAGAAGFAAGLGFSFAGAVAAGVCCAKAGTANGADKTAAASSVGDVSERTASHR